MNRLLAVVVVLLLAGTLVGGALVTRYRYGFERGIALSRVDTWTGQVQRWGSCARSHEEAIPIPSNFDAVISAAERRPDLERLDLADISDGDKRETLLQWLYGNGQTVNRPASDQQAWNDITNWIRDGQKQEEQAGKVVHGTSLWLSLLADKKNKDEWDLTHQVCEAGWK